MFTLTTEQFRSEFAQRVSRLYLSDAAREQSTREALDEFDRWLAVHDKSVRLEAIEDFKNALSTGVKTAYSYAD